MAVAIVIVLLLLCCYSSYSSSVVVACFVHQKLAITKSPTEIAQTCSNQHFILLNEEVGTEIVDNKPLFQLSQDRISYGTYHITTLAK